MCHGIFLTQDPIGLAGGVNLYAYAGDNPIASDDPFGLCDPPDSPICKFIVGVASHPGVQLLDKNQSAILAVASLPAAGMGGGAAISPEVAALGNVLRTSTNGLLRAGGVATRVAEAVGGTVSGLAKSEGYKVTVEGAKHIVARIKATGDIRVSIDKVGSLTREGLVSADRALTHLKNLSTEEIVGLIDKAKDLVGIPK